MVRKPAASTILKGNTWTFFRNDSAGCSTCVWRNTCVSGSSFHMDRRQYFLSLRGYRGHETPTMREGTSMHVKEQEGLRTPSEYGLTTFRADLEAGKEITLKEAPICSKMVGYRGHIDILKVRRERGNPPTYWIHIVEIKRSFSNRLYIMQPIAYAMILASPAAELLFEYPDLRNPRKTRTFAFKLYPEGQPLKLNITITLRTLLEKPRDYTERFMVNSEPTEWARGRMMGVMGMAKRLRAYHKPSIKFLGNMPYCSYCKRDENEECPMWADKCSRNPYRPLKKARPLFLGKRSKLLVKTKPHLTLSVPISVLESRNLMPPSEEEAQSTTPRTGRSG